MPAVVNKTVGSFSGTKEALGIISCPRFLKKDKNFSRSSDDFMIIYFTS
jgi:hypothetical protein